MSYSTPRSHHSNDAPGEELQSTTEDMTGKTYLRFCDTDLDYIYPFDASTLTTPTCPVIKPDFNQLKVWIEFDTIGGSRSDIISDSNNNVVDKPTSFGKLSPKKLKTSKEY